MTPQEWASQYPILAAQLTELDPESRTAQLARIRNRLRGSVANFLLSLVITAGLVLLVAVVGWSPWLLLLAGLSAGDALDTAVEIADLLGNRVVWLNTSTGEVIHP